MSITAMKLALSALAAMTRIHTEPAGFDGKHGKALTEFIGLQEKKIAAALASAESGIEALRTAIAEAEACEPVYWKKCLNEAKMVYSDYLDVQEALHYLEQVFLAAGAQPAPKQEFIQPGYQLVPVEPTDKMVQASLHLDLSYMPLQEGYDRAAVYKAMLAAAPVQAQPAPKQEPSYRSVPHGHCTHPKCKELFQEYLVLSEKIAKYEPEGKSPMILNAVPKQEPDTAYDEAKRLAEWLFKTHYASEECYASGRIVWEVCDTTDGVISQIDNMVYPLVMPAPVQAKQLLGNLDELSVGDSLFESWYASYVKEGTKGLKHHCRDAYAAGMGDPLVTYAQPAPKQEPQYPQAWAKFLHYPECWDTAAYPTLHAAIHEALAWSGCSTCKPAPKQEPFGYVSEHNCQGPFQFQFHKDSRSVYTDNCKSITVVYAAPVQTDHIAIPGKMGQPLTYEQIVWATESISLDSGFFLRIARAIKQAHGIGVQP